MPSYGPRIAAPSKLDPHKTYLEDRLKAGIVKNAQVPNTRIRQRGYQGGCTILKDWMQPQRAAGMSTAVRRFETPPGKQAQVDWGHLGYLETGGEQHQVWGFAITLGYSRGCGRKPRWIRNWEHFCGCTKQPLGSGDRFPRRSSTTG